MLVNCENTSALRPSSTQRGEQFDQRVALGRSRHRSRPRELDQRGSQQAWRSFQQRVEQNDLAPARPGLRERFSHPLVHRARMDS
jgi:hypothetical protein